MKRISDSTLHEIIDRIDLPEYIGAFVPLKRGSDHFSGKCPFHEDSSPSFHVWHDHFHCFGCRKSGDVFAYEIARSGCSFPEAVERLAARVGVSLDLGEEDPEKVRMREERRRLQGIMEQCAEHFHGLLMSPEGESARTYLAKRGFSESSLPLWKLGLAPNRSEVVELAKRNGWKTEDLKRLGMIREREEERRLYDFFRRRIMIPIRDERGVCIAFAGRIYEEQDVKAKDKIPKFINSPESPLYNKSRVLFNFDRARAEITRTGDVVVVEGYMDCSTLANAGITNVVAVSGVALTEAHLRMLAKCAKRVLLCFDSDSSGQAAALRSFSLAYPLGLVELLYLAVPQGKDPDEFVRAEGAQAFKELIAQSKPLLENVCNLACREHSTRESLIRHLKSTVVPVVMRHPDAALREVALEYLREVAGLSSAQLLLPGRGSGGVISEREPSRPGEAGRGAKAAFQERPQATEARRNEEVQNPAPPLEGAQGRSPELQWTVVGPSDVRLLAALMALRPGEAAAVLQGGASSLHDVIVRAQEVALLAPRTSSLSLWILGWLAGTSAGESLVEVGEVHLAEMAGVIRALALIARQERIPLEEMGLKAWPFLSAGADCRLHAPRDVLSPVNAPFVNLCLRDAIESSRRGTLPSHLGRIVTELERQLRWKQMLLAVRGGTGT